MATSARVFFRAVCGLGLLTAISPASAQIARIPLSFDRFPVFRTTEQKGDANEGKAEAKQQQQQFEQQIRQKIQQFNCDRRPSAVLKIWATPPEDEIKDEKSSEEDAQATAVVNADRPAPVSPPAVRIVNGRPLAVPGAARKTRGLDKKTNQKLKEFDKRLKTLNRCITLGEWPKVKQLLAEIESEEHRKSLYLRILDSLMTLNPSAMPAGAMANMSAEQQMLLTAVNRGGNAQPFPEKNLISIPDFVGLVDAAPCALEDAITKLGGILRNSLSAGSVLDELMLKLESATPLMPKRDAAKLLAAAGQEERLRGFLPTIEEAKAQDDREALNLLSRYFLAKHQQDPNQELLEQAWNVNQAVLAVGEVSKKEKQEALRRAVELVPKVNEELSQAWMNESFCDRPERGKEIIAAIGEACGQSMTRYLHSPEARQKLLELQSTAVNLLVESTGERAKQWQDALNLLAQNWMREANISLRFDQSQSFGPRMRRDAYGNIFYVDFDQPMHRHVDPKQPRPIASGRSKKSGFTSVSFPRCCRALSVSESFSQHTICSSQSQCSSGL